ncbi:MAG: efflux RND transporter periplasmic adaptor subunit [Verrucomicrobiota bacterium]
MLKATRSIEDSTGPQTNGGKVGRATILPLLTVLLTQCAKQEETAPESARPVTAIQLEESVPSSALRLTGAIKAWNEEDIAFEVSGRVTYIAEAGTYLLGRWTEDGTVIQEGDVLARIEPERYEASVKLAKADVAGAEARLKGADDELQKLLSASAAAVSQSTIDSTEAEVAGIQAEVEAAAARLTQAEMDLKNTELWAPFEAEVSEVFVQAGGYVNPGSPVAHLVMIDPVKIDVTVSAETHRQISDGDFVTVFVDGEPVPFPAAVYQKSTVADPATRTFTVTVIIRNRFVSDEREAELSDIPGIVRLVPLVHRESGDVEGPLFAEEELALYPGPNDSHFVWIVDDPALIESGVDLTKTPFRIRKVPVKLGEQRFNMQGIFQFRELKENDQLKRNMFSILGVPEEIQEKDEAVVILRRREWAMRPGGLVEVEFRGEEYPQGLYVPIRAIAATQDEKRGAVFRIEKGEDGKERARRIEVDLGGNAGETQLVTSDELKPGDRIAVEGASYLVEGEMVSIVSEEKTTSSL